MNRLLIYTDIEIIGLILWKYLDCTYLQGNTCCFVHVEDMEIDKEEEKDNTNKNNIKEKQVFQQVSQNPFPPDQTSKVFWMMNK